MLAYAFAITLLLGILIGVVATVALANYMEKREQERYRKPIIDPEIPRVSDELPFNVLDYSQS